MSVHRDRSENGGYQGLGRGMRSYCLMGAGVSGEAKAILKMNGRDDCDGVNVCDPTELCT